MNRTRLRLEVLESRLTPASLPSGFTETAVASGLTAPTAMEFSPDGKLFVTEQGGTAEVFQNGARLQANFFADAPLTVDGTGERGLLGIAFDPAYATNRFVYVYYTATSPTTHNRVSRFTASAAGDRALPGSEVPILDLETLSASNHNGGAIHFGPDGKLYIATGENNVPTNSQSLANRLGKILRINTDGSIPADNPFLASTSGGNQAIWALGLRNPFSFAFQPGTGRMFINDVGGSSFEEINDGRPGANYGWPTTEGVTTDPRFQSPFLAYGRSEGQAITGGAFYNPAVRQFPADFAGDYFYADFVAGFIRRVDTTTGQVTPFATGAGFPVDLRVDAAGNLYYLSRQSGNVFQVRYTPGGDTVGTFDPASATWYLRNGNSPGAPDVSPFGYGGAGWVPVVGDWNGDGRDTVGVFDPATGTWYLRNSNSPGAPDAGQFAYGLPGWVPVVGDWNGDGRDTVGVFDPATGTWYLRDGALGGAPDAGQFVYGLPGWVPVVGDWNGDGRTTAGVVDPLAARWYLRNGALGGAPDAGVFDYGLPGWKPLSGDFDGNRTSGIATVDPRTGQWYQRNTAGAGAPDATFAYGLGNWTPLAGNYLGPPASPASHSAPAELAVWREVALAAALTDEERHG